MGMGRAGGGRLAFVGAMRPAAHAVLLCVPGAPSRLASLNGLRGHPAQLERESSDPRADRAWGLAR